MSDLTRRELLRHGAVIGGLALGSIAAGPAVRNAIRAMAAPGSTFTRPLPVPEVLTDHVVELVAREAEVQILDGPATRMWTFNGQFPGPTIRRASGQTSCILLKHELPPAPAGVWPDDTLTLHHHGAHAASVHDGAPLPGQLVNPGDERLYVYEGMEDGEPERAAMQWYHDHSHHRTSFNAWMGLGGLFILDDEYEQALALPGGDYEVPLFLTDRTFDENNQLDIGPFLIGGNREVRGSTYLVNGAHKPFLEVEPRRYRLRFHNGAGFSLYNLKIAVTSSEEPTDAIAAEAVPMTQIGTESGLLPASVDVETVMLGNAERADVIVDFSGHAGQTLVLANVTRQASDSGTGAVTSALLGPGDATVPALFMQFVVGNEVTEPDPGPPPAQPRPLPDWWTEVPEQPTRVFTFGQGVDINDPTAIPHTINGQVFNHNRVDATPELGSVESWLLVNASPQTHHIHLHDVDWLVVSRNGAAPPAHQAGLKETFTIDPGEFILIGTKFSDHLGAYMLHCHMLDHEDSGMMARFDVVEPGQGSPTLMTEQEQVRTDALLVAARSAPGQPAPWPLVQQLLRTVRVDIASSPYICNLIT